MLKILPNQLLKFNQSVKNNREDVLCVTGNKEGFIPSLYFMNLYHQMGPIN